MAFLSGKNNNFKFQFPKVFVPEDIEKKYSPILNRIPGNMCTTVIDFLNYSIMSVELEVNPAEYEPIEQVDRGTPYGRLHRPDFYPDFLWKKAMTITFQLDSSYIIWAILTELFIYYYTAEPDPKYIPQCPGMEILDCYHKSLYKITFTDLLFTSVSGLDFNFSSNEVEQKTITTTWRANKVNIVLDASRI
jgi:hypothetical protein